MQRFLEISKHTSHSCNMDRSRECKPLWMHIQLYFRIINSTTWVRSFGFRDSQTRERMQEMSSLLFFGIRFKPLWLIHTPITYRWTHSTNDQHCAWTRLRLKKKIGRITAFFSPYFTRSERAFSSLFTFTRIQPLFSLLRVGHMSISMTM